MSSDEDVQYAIPDPAAWLVIAEDGFMMSFVREIDAERWKDRCSGTMHPLHAERHDEPHIP